jgi:hypothetical protein
MVANILDKDARMSILMEDARVEQFVPSGQDSWERRQPFEPTEETELELIPGHHKYVLGLPL